MIDNHLWFLSIGRTDVGYLPDPLRDLLKELQANRKQRLAQITEFACRCAALLLGLVGQRAVWYGVKLKVKDTTGTIKATLPKFFCADPAITPRVLVILGDTPTGHWVKQLAQPGASFGEWHCLLGVSDCQLAFAAAAGIAWHHQ
jgi:hypothetical protein